MFAQPHKLGHSTSSSKTDENLKDNKVIIVAKVDIEFLMSGYFSTIDIIDYVDVRTGVHMCFLEEKCENYFTFPLHPHQYDVLLSILGFR